MFFVAVSYLGGHLTETEVHFNRFKRSCLGRLGVVNGKFKTLRDGKTKNFSLRARDFLNCETKSTLHGGFAKKSRMRNVQNHSKNEI